MKVPRGSTVYGARRCKDARARGVRSMGTRMVRRGEGRWKKGRKVKMGVGKRVN